MFVFVHASVMDKFDPVRDKSFPCCLMYHSDGVPKHVNAAGVTIKAKRTDVPVDRRTWVPSSCSTPGGDLAKVRQFSNSSAVAEGLDEVYFEG